MGNAIYLDFAQQLAKRKADELEDFGVEQEHVKAHKHPKEVTDDGSRLVEEMLRTWAARCSADGDDVVMDDGANEDREFEVLKQCVEEYQERMEGNPWIQELITSL